MFKPGDRFVNSVRMTGIVSVLFRRLQFFFRKGWRRRFLLDFGGVIGLILGSAEIKIEEERTFFGRIGVHV